MFYIYVKFAVYLLVAISCARYAFGIFTTFPTASNKLKNILLIILLGAISAGSFYLAITNAAKFIYPHHGL